MGGKSRRKGIPQRKGIPHCVREGTKKYRNKKGRDATLSFLMEPLMDRLSLNHDLNRIRRSLRQRRCNMDSASKHHCDKEPAGWITLENGQHVPLDEEGKAIGGAGGWAKGKDFSKSKKAAAAKAGIPKFTPAKTKAEALEYAQQFCEKKFMDKKFKGRMDFGNLPLEHINAMNRALTEIYARFPGLEKLSGVKAVSPKSTQGKKAFKDGENAVFSYDPVTNGIFINKDLLKDPEAFAEYQKKAGEAWDTVMANKDRLTGHNREVAERYAKAGRSLVRGDTIEGLFTHEIGHHAGWTMFAPKESNEIRARAGQYAPNISGYATASGFEYMAESFVAYVNGERDILDPEFVEHLDRFAKGK